MASQTRIKTTGTILRNGSGYSFIAALPNGKEVVAFPLRDQAQQAATLAVGDRVTLELTVYDFSKAKIVGILPGAS